MPFRAQEMSTIAAQLHPSPASASCRHVTYPVNVRGNKNATGSPLPRASKAVAICILQQSRPTPCPAARVVQRLGPDGFAAHHYNNGLLYGRAGM